ncbi:MAG: pyrimidine-nucleoside phosphorylase [Oscillospiraceae bacterium]|nr:pyrimidine-nucleoside phosphorylase [Oscillospiraceae bacterium]
MRMNDLIEKKRDGGELTAKEIRWMIDGYTRGEIPDYQMSAMCMAICCRDMTDRETYELTMAMLDSGDRVDLSGIAGVKADKHSTGGVGDKTSLLLCPMVAACGVKMAKLSGRGLGHTGGTIDKLESFPGFSTAMSMDAFLRSVEENGFAIAGQTGELVPADKKLYALRDVTGTVPSIPLIVSSIMSKKLAAGADVIVLDVKTGSGAFMETEESAFRLARSMVDVGRRARKKVIAVVTDMDEPLGNAVGNALEVREALAALKGKYRGDLMELCLTLGTEILLSAGFASDVLRARTMLQKTIDDGTALERFRRFIAAQGGDPAAVDDESLLPSAPVVLEATSRREGYVKRMDTHGVGIVSMHLGGGRATKEDEIDLSVGVVLHKKVVDHVEKGESLGTIHARTEEAAGEAVMLLRACYEMSPEPYERPAFIKGVVR